MIDPENVPPVSEDELLARFIIHRDEARADGTVRPQLFRPYSYTELSVSRYRDSDLSEIWAVGRSVAAERSKTLCGLVNIRASACRAIPPLDVVARPLLPRNPNHADITGFPPRKEDQVLFSQKLAAAVEGKSVKPPESP